MTFEHDRTLPITRTPIPSLAGIDLPVPDDNRGWFKENWQREKLLALGLPDLGPVQNNIAKEVFRLSGLEPDRVSDVSSAQYFAEREKAPRPQHSELDLSRLTFTAYSPLEQLLALSMALRSAGS